MVSSHIPQENADYDDISMQESLIFSDSLQDLKNLRSQLYTAAEYFELSYTNDDQKQIVVDRLKDYAIDAILSTVDHLGSATYKVNDLLDEKVDEVSNTEIRVSCIEQRIRTCQQHTDCEGLVQQSLVINTPKYHKRYILPVGEATTESIRTKPKYHGCSLEEGDGLHQFRKAARATTIRETRTSPARKGRSPSPSPRPLQRASTVLSNDNMIKKESVKRSVSPRSVPPVRTGSLSSRPNSRATAPNPGRPNSRATTPNPSRPTTPNASNGLQQKKDNPKEIGKEWRKGKSLLKSLLNRRRKLKKDDMLYTYLDEY